MFKIGKECYNPGYFSVNASADTRRKEFDIKNLTLMENKINPDFIFIGDSIINYWELNAYFNKPDQLIINRGIGGDTTTYLAKRLWADALQLSPKYCIIGIGINDSLDLEGDYWRQIPGLPYDEVFLKAKENYIDIIEQCTRTSTIPIIVSLLPINIPVSLCEVKRKKFICDFNDFLYSYSKEKKIIYVDYYHTTVVPGTNILLDGITYDGLHPNANGYNIMATVLKNTLKKQNIII
ncbi:GDSL-type esterase/lipase family protein [Clostridium sp. AL.422]|uniref:SGNH/GDSL hydrolase family protein n=1 Tax=Clostridium TaxID=1485 RepID=UPI00293DA555|nr:MULTISPECIES: GDSL-type esterase/lipase family protein [unclassified Clostridium]MDV4152107.1 GDSL-type esterase/lipase family protein [Clostridium sp. AL.422]